MTGMGSIIYETTALIGMVVFIVGTLKTLLEDNSNANACKRKDSITRKKGVLFNTPDQKLAQPKSDAQNESSENHATVHKASEEHYTIEKMYSKNLSLLRSEKAQEAKTREVAGSIVEYDPNSFFSDVLDGFENSSNMLKVDSLGNNKRHRSRSQRNELKMQDSAKDLDQMDHALLSLIKGTKANLSRQNLSEVYLGLMKGFADICWLDLSYNQIKCLPEEFGSLEKLVHLDLKQNMLESLPDSFKNLSGLTYLDLSYNNLVDLGNYIET
jgi:Leucine-rich repeat (LRR) protein